MLTIAPSPSAALDPEVSAQLERVANDPTVDAPSLAAKLQEFVFKTVWESCWEQQQTREQCNRSRLLYILDGSGVLLERCSALGQRDVIVGCAISGAEALPIVAALGGDPRKDIDWGDGSDSLLRLRGELENAARMSCEATEGAIEAECVIKKQAALLGFPTAAGAYCAGQSGYHKRECLYALLRLAVYLEAIKRALNSSRPL